MRPESSIPEGYSARPDLLKDRIILITGAGDGFGRAAALACARCGASVILLGRTIKKLEAVYDAIEAGGTASGGPPATPAMYPLNLFGATWNDHSELAATVEREFGRLDGLVHNAAHFNSFTPLADLPPKDWIEAVQVNLTAAWSLTRLCMPIMRQRPDASIIFVADSAGRSPKAYRGAYGVTKYAIEGMVQGWAQELSTAPGLRINTYDPGPMRTALRLKGYPGEDPQRVPPPEAAVSGLLFLLGPDSIGRSGEAFTQSSG